MRRSSPPKEPFGYGIFPESEAPLDVSPSCESEKQSSAGHSNSFRSVDRNEPDLPSWKRKKKNVPRERKEYSGSLVPQSGPVGKKGEPLSLAEVLAQERSQGLIEPDYDETYEKLRQEGDATYLDALQAMAPAELVSEARKQRIDDVSEESDRRELIFRILKNRIRQNGLMFGEGTLEILPDQFGFLRSSDYHYLSCPDDIYISPSQIRRFGLRKGCTVSGQIRPPKENERYFALLRVEAINHEEPGKLNGKPFFDDLTPILPDRRIVLESSEGDLDTRILPLIVPIGFGQRGLIVSPPQAGKTSLVRKMTKSILANHPEVYVFNLLIDERPEEVTDTIRQLRGPRCEVISSTFDEPSLRHIQIAEMVLEKAKRMVEYGKDVIIFLDSITRLAKAWSNDAILQGKSNVENSAYQALKKYFGAARQVESGGSLTILATVLIETESAADDALFEEFKGTGNLEIRLDRALADKRIWPAINISKSGTRREEMLFASDEYQSLLPLRQRLADMPPEDAITFLRDRLHQTATNVDFLETLAE